MKRIFLFIKIITSTIILLAQEATDAPFSLEFQKWLKEYHDKNFQSGDIPSPALIYFNKTNTDRSNKNFDPVFDMRTTGWVSPPKNQGNCGVCWTFTTMGVIESYLLKNNMGLFDLSEQHLRTCHGFTLDASLSCRGGNYKKSAAYLFRNSGPINETDNPYTTSMYDTCIGQVQPIFMVKQLQIIPGNIDLVKQALLDHGALYTNMRYNSSYYNSSNYTYYCPVDSATNHAVLLIGWDDNKITAGGTGAWIVKNSWGTSWGENGYFYISYNDNTYLKNCAAFTDITPYDTSIKLLYYDELGWTGNYGYSNPTAYILVKFVAPSDIKIKSIGTYIVGENGSLELAIYDTKDGNNLLDLLTQVTTQNFTYPGYYTIELPSELYISENNDFYVKIKYNIPNAQYPIPIEKFVTDYANPTIEDNIFWVSYTGNSWTAMGNSISGKERDPCVHIYYENQISVKTITNSSNIIKIYPNPTNDYVTISFNNTTPKYIKITDVTGKNIDIYQTENTTNTTINMTHLKKGIYFITIYDQDNLFRTKIFKY